MDALMDHTIEGMVTTLQLKEWLRKVDKAGLLCLLAILHFLQPPITMLVIKQLLYLVHEDTLWVSKPVYITTELVHWVLHLPCARQNLLESTAKSNDVGMIEQLKKTYKLVKGT